MVIGLNGRIPLNTAGNLAGTGSRPAPSTWATRSARSTRPMRSRMRTTGDYDPFNIYGNTYPHLAPIRSAAVAATGGPSTNTNNAQVDNAVDHAILRYLPGRPLLQAIDVRLTQLRNLLAGTRPQPTRRQPHTNRHDQRR